VSRDSIGVGSRKFSTSAWKDSFLRPKSQKITIFTDNRHIKDILRSLSHELVHHKQNLQGMFDGTGHTGPGYAQKDQHLRDMEREAYEKGNLCLRDWEDKYKKQLQESIYNIKGDNSKMSYKNWRNQEVNDRLMESWGFKAPKAKILTESTRDGGISEGAEESLPASMQRVLAQFAEEDVLDYMLSRKSPEGTAARGTGLRGTGDRGSDVGIKGITTEEEGVEEGIGSGIKGAVKGASKLAGKVGGGLAGGAAGALTLNPLSVAAGALGGQKLGGMAAEKAADLVVNEDGEELSEGAEESLPASMQRVLAQFAEEDVLDYMMARKSPEGKAARGTGLRGTGERGGDVGIKGITTEISLEESKIRKTIREAITKALKNREA
jgi:hypothetical protein